MKGSPKIGTTGEQQFVVELKHAIDFADGRMPAVLSTPWLIWFLEHAARAAVLPLLEPGESSVGMEIQVRHLAPTPLLTEREKHLIGLAVTMTRGCQVCTRPHREGASGRDRG